MSVAQLGVPGGLLAYYWVVGEAWAARAVQRGDLLGRRWPESGESILA
jgi:hypothetical protein